jgi:hypothetical protein
LFESVFLQQLSLLAVFCSPLKKFRHNWNVEED